MSSDMFPPAPEPPTPLGRHRILSPTAGVRVSPLCLGTMNFGDAWTPVMGECNEKTTFDILDTFYESGGNFIDTANNYQNEESEQRIGKWMKQRGNRDQMVLATKYTTNYLQGKKGKFDLQSNFTGNNAKSMHVSVESSLKKLGTDYIDLLYLHWWDMTTSVEEVMQSLNRLVQSGKVIYLGVSDTPAWIVSKANQYARDHGLRPFSVYQGQWNASQRDLENDVVPMCIAEGMAIAPWKALGGGAFKTEAQMAQKGGRADAIYGGQTEELKKMSSTLENVAKNHKTNITSIALAYVMHAAPDCYPIVGGRNVNHLKDNIEALKIRLSDAEYAHIQEASGFKPLFPQSFIFGGSRYDPNGLNGSDVPLTKTNFVLDCNKPRQPILPAAK
ncbi:MAG: hypothetical protein M1828_003422 [Chrysothrix sp. TS-e1954]|nr:MAG: hypothetical protein M1828_003422 [Chrysothrix sp. TS-e1954]